MRFLILSLLFLSVSCIQETSTSTRAKKDKQEETVHNGVDTVNGVDLLDVQMELPVVVKDGEILIQKTDSKVAQGERTSCSLKATAGEVIRYTIMGSEVEFYFEDGSRQMFARSGAEGDSIIGSWSMKESVGEGKVRHRISLVNERKMYISKHCEMAHK